MVSFGEWVVMATLRACWILFWFIVLTLVLVPLQWLFVRLNLPLARHLPYYYHRMIGRIVGLRVHVDGAPVKHGPLLLVANHISWMDIIVFSALRPLSFVAKKEVSTWPGVQMLAKLQMTIFVDRERRTDSHKTSGEIARRLAEGDCIILFPEGTSSDGNRVLPFKSALFGALGQAEGETMVQTAAIAYTALGGLPLGRRTRPLVAWYGDMEMANHVWTLLKAGPLDAHVRFGAPLTLSELGDRKALASHTEAIVRHDVSELLSLRPFEKKLKTPAPQAD